MDETAQLLPNHNSIQNPLDSRSVIIYTRRYYIMLVFSLLSFTSGFVWNCFGPIENSVESLFNWTNSEIDLLANWGNISVLVVIPFLGFIYKNEGHLRQLVVSSAVFLALGTGIRCLNFSKNYFTISAHACAIINGIPGAITNILPPVISAVWFSEDSRTAATTFGIISYMLGTAASFLAGTLVVSDVEKHSPYYRPHLLHRFKLYMYLQFLLSLILAFVCLIYFPSQPPTPPTRSASVERFSMLKGTKKVLKMFDFWLVLVASSAIAGSYVSFLAILAIILKPLSVSQFDAGLIGFISTCVFLVGGMIVASILDMIKQKTKAVLIFIVLGSALSFLWLVLIAYGVFPAHQVSIYVSNILAGFFVNASSPLFYELSCETCFPVSEFIVSLLLNFGSNMASSTFLLIAMIPNIGSSWIIITMTAICFLTLPALLIYKEQYFRLTIDQNTLVVPVEPPSHDE